MAHTYINCLVHCVFGTKDRQHTITPEIQNQLRPFLAGIARDNGIKALAVGGTSDHIHLLLSFPATIAIATAIQRIKGTSSHWINENIHSTHFSWQEGYGAFTVGASGVSATIKYIENKRNIIIIGHSKRNTSRF